MKISRFIGLPSFVVEFLVTKKSGDVTEQENRRNRGRRSLCREPMMIREKYFCLPPFFRSSSSTMLFQTPFAERMN